MYTKKIFLLSTCISSFFVFADNSSENTHSHMKSINQHKMLINRKSSLLLEIEKLELIKSNTQNPLLYKKTIHDLEPLYKEIEVIQKIQKLLTQNNFNQSIASED